ncbi:MAG: hypothetical protein EAZ84_11740 [Verrucomicrobia bacterium]|nr:MAG: hypothetical protein EAZ84_11740 [Verrucomicrobiota bacterium]TAE89398.1 MAG: hypothetical protein EAZ82_01920 [Verrucomicrobiota bacterium]
MKASRTFLVSLVAGLLLPIVSASEAEFVASSKAEEIGISIRDLLRKSRDEKVEFRIEGVGEFSYSPPLADDNKRNPWHAFAQAGKEQESKDYKIIQIRIKGSQWFHDGKLLTGADELSRIAEATKADQKLCAVISLDANSTPFFEKHLFRDAYRLLEGRYIFLLPKREASGDKSRNN